MLYSDLRQLKAVLEIDPCDKSEDERLLFFLEFASRWIEERCNRPDFSYKQRTEYYDGRGTQTLLLRNRPVYNDPPIEVYLDVGAYYGQVSGSFNPTLTQLTNGADFALKIDRPDGTSKSGILYRVNAVWPMQWRRQGGYLSPFPVNTAGSIKVVYWAGYTVDNAPPMIRLACNTLVAKMRSFFPLGMEVAGEGYKDRSLSYMTNAYNYLMSTVDGMLVNNRNWNW